MPGPSENGPRGTKVLRIGREPDNDLVVDLPMVSGHHARVVWEGPGSEVRIEDLGSSNGTALGAPDRKVTRATLTAADTIYLGSHAIAAADVLRRLDPSLMPVLAYAGGEMVVGRSAENGHVLDMPMVSGRHARFRRAGNEVVVEDLGSSNGTFVNGKRVEGPVVVRSGDVVGFGSYAMLLDVDLTVATAPGRGAATVFEPTLLPPMPGRTPAAAATVRVEPDRGLLVPAMLLLAQAPLLTVGIVLASRAGGASAEAPAALATVLAGLGIAAVWFGLSDALLGGVVDARMLRGGGGTLAGRLGMLAGICLGQCIVAWAVAAAMAGLKGPGIESVGLLALASGAGLAVGLILVAVAPRPVGWAALPLALVALWGLGGRARPLADLPAPARAVAGAMPSRWAFEGLMELEAGRRPPIEEADAPARDLAEDYFPSETLRTGPRGSAMALTFLLVGAAASAAFIAWATRPTG